MHLIQNKRTIEHIVQGAIFTLSGFAIMFVNVEGWAWLGPIMGILAQPFWFYESWLHKQWGIFLLTVWHLAAWVVGIWTYTVPHFNEVAM